MPAKGFRKTHCVRGHARTVDNVRPNGNCIQCQLAAQPQIKKTHCIRGHERTPDNITKSGNCRTCGLEYSKRFHQEHLEFERERARSHQAAHPERRKESFIKFLAEHPGYALEHQRAWAKANPEKTAEHRRRTRKKHPETKKAAHHRRKARKLGNGGSWTPREWRELKATCGFKCICCFRSEEELIAAGLKLVPDHIQPLIKGGRNSIENLQPLCHGLGGCNNIKGAKWIDYRLGFPLEIV